MSTGAILMMVAVIAIVWGGFIASLIIAMRDERLVGSQEKDVDQRGT
jgi:hypothetical protein